MALIPDIQSTVARNIGLTELSIRGSLRVTQTLAKVAPRALRWGLQRKRPPASEVRELFEALGATYIKFGQFIASSPSVFPKEYVDEFEKLLDQTTPIPFRTIEKIRIFSFPSLFFSSLPFPPSVSFFSISKSPKSHHQK